MSVEYVGRNTSITTVSRPTCELIEVFHSSSNLWGPWGNIEARDIFGNTLTVALLLLRSSLIVFSGGPFAGQTLGLAHLGGSLLQWYFLRSGAAVVVFGAIFTARALWGHRCTLGELQIQKFLLADTPSAGLGIPEVSAGSPRPSLLDGDGRMSGQISALLHRWIFMLKWK